MCLPCMSPFLYPEEAAIIGASGIICVRCGDFSRLPGPKPMGGVRVFVPERLNPRFMLTPTISLSPFFVASFCHSPVILNKTLSKP